MHNIDLRCEISWSGVLWVGNLVCKGLFMGRAGAMESFLGYVRHAFDDMRSLGLGLRGARRMSTSWVEGRTLGYVEAAAIMPADNLGCVS